MLISRRILVFSSLGVLAVVAVGATDAHHVPTPAKSQVKASTESAQINTAASTTSNSGGQTTKPDVEVNGHHMDVPENGSASLDLAGGGKVEVSNQEKTGSSTNISTPSSSVNVSITSDGGTTSSNSHTHVFSSNSGSHTNSWSQLNVDSTGSSDLQIHN